MLGFFVYILQRDFVGIRTRIFVKLCIVFMLDGDSDRDVYVHIHVMLLYLILSFVKRLRAPSIKSCQ